MALGTRKPGQIPISPAADELPRAPTAPIFVNLNELLAQMGFDAYVEKLSRPFYVERMGRPSLAPGVYFRLLLGYARRYARSVDGRALETQRDAGRSRS